MNKIFHRIVNYRKSQAGFCPHLYCLLFISLFFRISFHPFKILENNVRILRAHQERVRRQRLHPVKKEVSAEVCILCSPGRGDPFLKRCTPQNRRRAKLLPPPRKKSCCKIGRRLFRGFCTVRLAAPFQHSRPANLPLF